MNASCDCCEEIIYSLVDCYYSEVKKCWKIFCLVTKSLIIISGIFVCYEWLDWNS